MATFCSIFVCLAIGQERFLLFFCVSDVAAYLRYSFVMEFWLIGKNIFTR